MAAPRFTIVPIKGDSEVVHLRPAQQVAYETEYDEPLFAEDESIRMSKIYQLAWFAAGKPDTFEEWLETLESVEMVNEGEADEGEDESPT